MGGVRSCVRACVCFLGIWFGLVLVWYGTVWHGMAWCMNVLLITILSAFWILLLFGFGFPCLSVCLFGCLFGCCFSYYMSIISSCALFGFWSFAARISVLSRLFFVVVVVVVVGWLFLCCS
ncbi:hypothetical protein B0T19DRAFT_419506 [Cercophora scortea]|uniref:Uncharacterized protein n=1 Tax=Cercophora scortea TaxID=314031 RepID=A0AAE0IZU9_9PEZI|nr:hypothetical protein B0T19DRAFT_419506 [Cercophora scortea]